MSILLHFLADLLHVDNTDLYVFNSGTDAITDVVFKAQRLLNAWHEALKFAGGDLKLVKCYWNLQAYSCKDGVHKCNATTSESISVTDKKDNTAIKHVSTDKMRILEEVLTIPSN